ncbi:unnamed protein product, partial [Ectocarpus sp. 13 AM-2016]
DRIVCRAFCVLPSSSRDEDLRVIWFWTARKGDWCFAVHDVHSAVFQKIFQMWQSRPSRLVRFVVASL